MANSRRATVGWSIAFGFLWLMMLSVALETALHFLGPPIDGPFQLYNALRRITAGQRPGVDFQFFHGVLIPYLHYPVFRLLGGGFIQSELARQLVSTVLYPITVLVFLKFFLRDWTRTMAWATIVMAGSIALRMTSVLVAVNSLLGIRSTLPVLMPVVLALPWTRGKRIALATVATGGALLLGSEQGLALIGALSITYAVLIIRGSDRRAHFLELLTIVGGGAALLMLVLAVLGGFEGMRSALRYNFRTVPLDQYWYFGSPPNIFLTGWAAAPKLLFRIWQTPFALVAGLLISVYALARTWRSGDDADRRRNAALCVGVVYGLLSCASLLGIFVNAYVQPLLRVLLLVGAIDLAHSLGERDRDSGRPLRAGVGRSTVGLAIAVFLIMIAVVPSVITSTFVTMPHIVRDHVIGGQGAVYAGIWPETMPRAQSILDEHRSPSAAKPTVWSTYAGLLEARNGMFHPSTDYIIHVLGPSGREKYLNDFRATKPELVQTVRPLFTQYETWIEATSWDFYAEVLRNYRVIGATPWSLFWERLPSPMPAPALAWQVDVPPNTDVVQLPAVNTAGAETGLLQIELEYEIHNPLHALPVLGAMPRYLVHFRDAVVRDPITLDPYVTTSRFPLIVANGRAPAMHWQTYGLLPGASITVKRIRAYAVPIGPQNLTWYNEALVAQSNGLNQ